MPGYSDFGVKVRGVMLKKNITLTALAEQLGISTPYLSDILRGARDGKRHKERIAEILGIEKKAV